MRANQTWVVIPAVALVVTVGTLVRCGNGGNGASSAADADAGRPDAADTEAAFLPEASSDAPSDGLLDVDADAPCVVPPKPAQVPANWVEFTDWSCARPFYIPASADDMPEPIQWEPCSDKVAQSLSCRSMKITWPHNDSPVTWARREDRIWVDEQGHALLAFARNSYQPPQPDWQMALIADVDGPVRFAIMQPHAAAVSSVLVSREVVDGHFTIQVQGDGEPNAYESTKQGVLVGEVGNLRPKLLARYDTTDVLSWTGGSKWVEREVAPEEEIWLHPVDGGAPFLLTSVATDPDHAQPTRSFFYRDIATLDIGNLRVDRVMIYDDAKGLRPLIGQYGNLEEGDYNHGTDGNFIVWTHGSGHPTDTESIYPTRSIMVSPFTTDPSQIQPRRLRSDPNQAADDNFVVGCGYAARSAPGRDGLLVVRLSDGWSWVIPSNDTPGARWLWAYPIGMTCDEIFAVYADTEQIGDASPPPLVPNIARVRLDSLGAGMAPD